MKKKKIYLKNILIWAKKYKKITLLILRISIRYYVKTLELSKALNKLIKNINWIDLTMILKVKWATKLKHHIKILFKEMILKLIQSLKIKMIGLLLIRYWIQELWLFFINWFKIIRLINFMGALAQVRRLMSIWLKADAKIFKL